MTVARHPITGEPILRAPARALRPRAFDGAAIERCPFCPGHEADTPPELLRVGEPWAIRVVPNKYPPAKGAEVVIESPLHEATFEAIANPERVVQIYVERHRAHADAAHVALFKNEGERAGASIPHLHSQLVPLHFVPPRIEREIEGFERASRCPLCRPDGALIRESEHFLWLVPSPSPMPWQQWIVPRRHVSGIASFTDAEVADLASLLQASSRAMRRIAASYNWLFQDFRGARAAHAYIELFPRLTGIAGLELGSGTFVEIIDPDAAAERLRN